MTQIRGKERSRQRILEAAGRAFSEVGYDKVSMEEIARRAGLTRMTVYNLFSSKEEIAMALARSKDAEVAPMRQAQLESGASAIDLMSESLTLAARWCLANPSLAKVVLSSKVGVNSYDPPDYPSFQGFICDLAALGQRQGRVRVDVSANVFASVLLGSFTLIMLTTLAGAPFEEIWIAQLVNMLLEGFGPLEKKIHFEKVKRT